MAKTIIALRKHAVACLCLSVYHKSEVLSKRLNESGWFFGTGTSFDLSYTVL